MILHRDIHTYHISLGNDKILYSFQPHCGCTSGLPTDFIAVQFFSNDTGDEWGKNFETGRFSYFAEMLLVFCLHSYNDFYFMFI